VSPVGGALTRIGDMMQANGLMVNPMVEGAFASTVGIMSMSNLPIVGTIITAFYALGHLFKFLGECFSGHFNWHTVRELAGALICGAAAGFSFMCPAFSLVNGAALAADMTMQVLEDAARERDAYNLQNRQLGAQPMPPQPMPQPMPQQYQSYMYPPASQAPAPQPMQ
jgi:hypothetical protein